MLKISIIPESDGPTRIVVEGRLAGEWARELTLVWDESRTWDVPQLLIDLDAVTDIDSEGKRVLSHLLDEGAHFRASGLMTQYILNRLRGHKGSGMRDLLLLAATVLLFFPLCGVLRAQQAPLRLTLTDAVHLALRQNPQVQISHLNLAVSNQDRNLSRSALLPQGVLQVSDRVQRENFDALFGRPSPNGPQVIGPNQVFQAGVGFSAPIFDLTLWRRYQESKSLVNASAAQIRTVQEQTTLLVVSQYLGCLRASADVDEDTARVKLADALATLAQHQEDNGIGTGIDTLRARVELQNERQRLLVARNQYETSLYGLARLLSLDPHQPIELTDRMRFFDTPPVNADQSLAEAFEHRPEMQENRAQRQAAKREYQAAVAEVLPSVDFSGFWSQAGLSINSTIPDYQYQASVQIPLFTGGRLKAERVRARLQENTLEQKTREIRDQITLELKTAVANLESARHQVDVANLGYQLAVQEVGQARDRFAAGVTNNVEVIQAQDGLARAADNRISALYQYNQARADLARATGQMQALYAK